MTPIMKRTENKENAVSPVVGVMLMLVVTIVIAAVVTVFATGVVTTTEKAPIAMLTATVDSTWDDGYMNGEGTVMITSLSGDTVDFGKVKTIVSVEKTETTGTKTYTYTYVGKSGGKLESGSTFNLAYKCSGFTKDSNNKNNYGLTSLLGLDSAGKSLNSGEYVHVTVVYDDQHILYDKEVVAV